MHIPQIGLTVVSLQYFKYDIDFVFRQKSLTILALNRIFKDFKLGSLTLSVVFTSDKQLLKINKERLSHNYLTDIITFDLSTPTSKKEIDGEMYISIDRVRENSLAFSGSFSAELCRVIIHGTLHLLGKNDESENEKLLMRGLENKYLFPLFHMKHIKNKVLGLL
ncbi:MAG: rRNA maturation RNase YbeY [Flavobacteriaceae bacterium]|nr:rRNA maturation RNase YbeY [Flavobacteriaceae bacterium]